MSRPHAAVVAGLLALAGAARAQQSPPPTPGAAPAPGGPAAEGTPAPSPGAAPVQPSPENDPRVQAAIQRAVDKAKEEIRNEVRAELQGAQSAAAFMGTVAERQPKVELFELDGYYRVRAQMLNKLNLRGQPDSAGFNYFPKPFRAGSTIETTNMRLRLEPTINASESVRVRAQIDVLDNWILGSNPGQVSDNLNPDLTSHSDTTYPVPFYGSTRTYTPGDKTNDRDPIIPRRVWGEFQTPLGLLSFGRMPSSWGLGILANAGTGLDQDFGDTVDRIQVALPPVGTPIGQLVFVPIFDFDITGVAMHDPHGGAGQGQPLDADPGADARTLAFKVVRLDTEDDIRRKLDRGERSVNYGLYFNHRAQRYVYPSWLDQGYSGNYNPASTGSATFSRRGASANFASLWFRFLGPRLRVESEVVGLYGSIGNANAGSNEALAPAHLHMRQWGGVLQVEAKASGKFSYGAELGAASGDGAPGFGNDPTRGTFADPNVLPNYGAIEGPQWGRPGDDSINNFRFNPAYTVDLIFYRRILGQVTDSIYLRPNTRWEIINGLVLNTSLLYAQAQCPSSTPSSSSAGPGENSPLDQKGKRPLALELDNTLTLTPTHGFTGWMDFGLLKPLAGMGTGTSMAWMIDLGLAATF